VYKYLYLYYVFKKKSPSLDRYPILVVRALAFSTCCFSYFVVCVTLSNEVHDETLKLPNEKWDQPVFGKSKI
jgi:hypothetical protein